MRFPAYERYPGDSGEKASDEAPEGTGTHNDDMGMVVHWMCEGLGIIFKIYECASGIDVISLVKWQDIVNYSSD